MQANPMLFGELSERGDVVLTPVREVYGRSNNLQAVVRRRWLEARLILTIIVLGFL